MNRIYSFLLTALVCLFTACGSAKTKVDTAPVDQAFASAPAEIKTEIGTIVSAVSSMDYKSALQPLDKVISSRKMDDTQKQALSALISDMQRVVAENQSDFTMEVYTGLSQLVGKLHEYGVIRP